MRAGASSSSTLLWSRRGRMRALVDPSPTRLRIEPVAAAAGAAPAAPCPGSSGDQAVPHLLAHVVRREPEGHHTRFLIDPQGVTGYESALDSAVSMLADALRAPSAVAHAARDRRRCPLRPHQQLGRHRHHRHPAGERGRLQHHAHGLRGARVRHRPRSLHRHLDGGLDARLHLSERRGRRHHLTAARHGAAERARLDQRVHQGLRRREGGGHPARLPEPADGPVERQGRRRLRVCRLSAVVLRADVSARQRDDPADRRLAQKLPRISTSYSSGFSFSIDGNIGYYGAGAIAGDAGATWDSETSTTVPSMLIEAGNVGNQGAQWTFDYCTTQKDNVCGSQSIQPYDPTHTCQNAPRAAAERADARQASSPTPARWCTGPRPVTRAPDRPSTWP